MAVAEWAGTLVDWRAALEELKAHLAPALGRAETRASAGAFIDGLLSGVERKTGWILAEEAGLDRPYRIQSLLGRSAWSADVLRERVQDYVAAAFLAKLAADQRRAAWIRAEPELGDPSKRDKTSPDRRAA
ncbi:transposase [Novosphingobium sp. PP1Y]|uniref:transposase n=1 Tax=Novosphingobium sp. PP1Y TaxID=702113 RepID=UPI00020EEC61|nr:transposase [Novosphingobium sp. PP1Y]